MSKRIPLPIIAVESVPWHTRFPLQRDVLIHVNEYIRANIDCPSSSDAECCPMSDVMASGRHAAVFMAPDDLAAAIVWLEDRGYLERERWDNETSLIPTPKGWAWFRAGPDGTGGGH